MSLFSRTVMNEGNRNLYNNLFSSSNRSYGFNQSNILSDNSFSLGDYSMIKSGVYKKLLTEYYKTENDNSSDKESSVKPSDNKASAKLVEVKNDAKSLNDAAKKLSSRSLYRTKGVETDGELKYDRESIEKAVKGYVSAYNEYIDSSAKSDSTSILSKTLSMVKTTANNSKLLKEAGITIGADNKLSVDNETLRSADISTLKSLFTGSGSYIDTIAGKASESYRMANSMAYNNTHASSYTYKGSYSYMGTSNSYLDKYM